ncbi:MAG TPA: SRPBCC family protein [Candidatus Nanopelagicales bacterium]
MSGRKHLVRSVIVDAPQETVFAALVDWETQGAWMLGTSVRAEGAAHGVGGRLAAFTGVGRVGFLDTMEVVEWEPPRLVRVRHTGHVVRGDGVFEVLALPEGRSRFVWREELELPLGALGRAGYALVRPAFAAGVDRSLRRFAALVACGELGAGPAPEPPHGVGPAGAHGG